MKAIIEALYGPGCVEPLMRKLSKVDPLSVKIMLTDLWEIIPDFLLKNEVEMEIEDKDEFEAFKVSILRRATELYPEMAEELSKEFDIDDIDEIVSEANNESDIANEMSNANNEVNNEQTKETGI